MSGTEFPMPSGDTSAEHRTGLGPGSQHVPSKWVLSTSLTSPGHLILGLLPNGQLFLHKGVRLVTLPPGANAD